MKLTKQQARLHAEACEILKKDSLDYEDKVFVLDNWHEGATNINGSAGAFFTPRELANDLAVEVCGKYIVDLCAGIGSLSFAVERYHPETHITCVEINPEYVAVGKKIMPNAVWIQGDAFDYKLTGRDTENIEWDLAARGLKYDCAISNPPFGNVKTNKNRFGGFEYDLIWHARRLSRDGVFILPQMSVPWKYSGQRHFEKVKNERYEKFNEGTGITLSMNCGIDTSCAAKSWKFPVPTVEIALGYEVPE